jgi:hypothetical protein
VSGPCGPAATRLQAEVAICFVHELKEFHDILRCFAVPKNHVCTQQEYGICKIAPALIYTQHNFLVRKRLDLVVDRYAEV